MRKLALAFLVICLFGSISADSQDKAVMYNSGNSGLPNNFVSSVAIDNSGNKWIGTWDGGMAKFDGKDWTVFNTGNSDLPDNFVNAIAIDSHNGVWVGTDKGLSCYDGKIWKKFDGLPDDHIRSLTIDNSGNVWVGTRQGGLAKFNGKNWTIYNTDNSGLRTNYVRAISIDGEGNIWIGTDNGLVEFDGKNWTQFNSGNSGLPSDNVSAISIDNLDNKWVATSLGLVEFHGARWTLYSVDKSSLPNNNVLSVATDEEGMVWVGTSAGIAEFDGMTWITYNAENSGLANVSVNSIVIDEAGNKWIGTSSGLAESFYSIMSAGFANAYRSIREGRSQDAIQSIRDYFSKRKLDELGYTQEFFKAFQSLLSQRNNDVAIAVLDGLARLSFQDVIGSYVRFADLFSEMGDPSTSVTILSKVLSSDPGNKEASEKLGQAYFFAGRYDEVIRIFGNTGDHGPTRFLALSYEKKSMLVQANKVWQAIADSLQSDSAASEANDHIRQNTIALMTTNPEQTAAEENSRSPQPQQPTPKTAVTSNGQSHDIGQPPVTEVDSEIPRSVEDHPDAVALILAIPQYQSAGIPDVKYAKNDAEIIRQYLIKAMGFKPENILPMVPDEQLTYGRIQTYIKSILPSYLKPDGSSDLFIYFTGHGAPSTANHEAYLVPWDGDPNYVNDNNSYSMKKFYVDIELLNARHKTIIVDACFSGYSGNGATLLKSASPIYLKLNNPLVADPNTVIFQSSSVDQVSNWYDEKRHGMFTYFFLKGLQGAADYDHDGTITADELMKYINDQNNGLPYWSNRLYQRPQDAQLEGNGQTVIERIEK